MLLIRKLLSNIFPESKFTSSCEPRGDSALSELLRRAQQRELLKLRGKIQWEGNLNKSREGR